MPKVRIGPWQLLTIMGNLVFGKAIGYTSEVLTRTVGNDAWLAMLVAFVTGAGFMVFTVWLARRFGAEPPTQYIPRVMGGWMGRLVMLIFALFFFGAFMTSAITIEQHINDYLMTETPLIIFVVLYTLLSIYAVYLGIEVAGRLSVLGLGLIILLDVLLVVGSADHLVPSRLLPLLDHGLWNVAVSSFAAHTDVAMATGAALLLLPISAVPVTKWLKLTLWGLSLGAVLTLVWPVFELGVLGPEVTAQYLIACMQMARAAELSIYLHRYEMLMVILFVYGVLTQSVVLLHSGIELLRACIPWRIPRWLFVTLCGLLTIWPQHVLAHDRDRYGLFLANVWPAISVPVAYGVPVLIAAVALLRGMAGQTKRDSRRSPSA